ncbi:MAG: tryptophan--tRNA ligase [Alphaproteobacteria bacterium]|nr:tryptophan--tRNA ligase [Alphaproteobacteria bacterium]
MNYANKTILTGVKPTGTLHIGNYVGAIRPAIELGHQVNQSGRHVMFVADYHAINAIKDAPLLAQLTKEIACAYLACGLNPNHSVFYRQSDVPELFELTTILMAYTPKGFMNKAHAYKAAVDKNIAKGEPQDAGINMGLYTYPVLMAADILAYDTDMVPVGKDQVQHVEIAADIAGSINALYDKEVLKIPTSFLTESAQVLPGTDGRKMSKSYNNVIPLFAEDNVLKKAVMGIKTDCQDINAPKNPDEILLYQIARGVASETVVAEIKEGLEKGGMGYGTIKKMILQAIMDEMAEKREKYVYYLSHFDEVEDMLQAGAVKARALAHPVLERVKDAVFNR